MDPNASPFNALPRVVVLLAIAIAGVELVFWAGSVGLAGGVTSSGTGLRGYGVETYSFFPEAVHRMLLVSRFPFDWMIRFVTYPFVHVSFTSAIFVLVFVLALGKMVGEVFSGFAVAAVFFGAAIFGALVYTFSLNDPRPLIGGMPAAYGLIGAYTFILWVGYGATGASQWQAFRLIGFLMGIQLIFGLLFGSSNMWVAEIGGFAAGFAIAVLASPGGLKRFLAQVRRR